jgi:hypothetical protein
MLKSEMTKIRQVKYGYDSYYKRGYFIPTDIKNKQGSRYYIWKTYDGFQLYRLGSDSLGIATNTPLLLHGVKRNDLREMAFVLANNQPLFQEKPK